MNYVYSTRKCRTVRTYCFVSLQFREMSVTTTNNWRFIDVLGSLLVDNGVTLRKALTGKAIYDNLTSAHDGTFTQSRFLIDDMAKVDEKCDKISDAKNWPCEVLKSVRALASSATTNFRPYNYHAGCGAGPNGGLFVFVSMVYKSESGLDVLVLTSHHNVTLKPEEIENIVIQATSSAEFSEMAEWNGNQSWQVKHENRTHTRVEMETRQYNLDARQLNALRAFGLAKVCQRWITRERASQIAGLDTKIQQILTFDFLKPLEECYAAIEETWL